jgi:hypothetical protein
MSPHMSVAHAFRASTPATKLTSSNQIAAPLQNLTISLTMSDPNPFSTDPLSIPPTQDHQIEHEHIGIIEPLTKSLSRIITFIKFRSPSTIVSKVDVEPDVRLFDSNLLDGFYAHTYLVEVNDELWSENELHVVLSKEFQDYIYYFYRLKKAWCDKYGEQFWTVETDNDEEVKMLHVQYTEYLVRILALVENEEEERRYKGEVTYDF